MFSESTLRGNFLFLVDNALQMTFEMNLQNHQVSALAVTSQGLIKVAALKRDDQSIYGSHIGDSGLFLDGESVSNKLGQYQIVSWHFHTPCDTHSQCN